jgi:SAM-dependent methyltransferase
MRRTRPPDAEARSWYQNHVERFGYDHRALGFGQRSSQQRRFDAALALGAFHGRSVLDAGCGFGDLLAYLNARGINPRYTGLDICPPMIERCRRRFPENAERFVVADVLEYEPPGQFDYVVASGLFGLVTRDTVTRVRPTVKRLFAWSRVGLAVNFLSSRAPRRSAQRLYVDAGAMLAFALSLTPAVRLDHTYLPNDFTVCLYRTPSWQAE